MHEQVSIEIERRQSRESRKRCAKQRDELRAAVSDFLRGVIALRQTIEALPDSNAVWRNGADPQAPFPPAGREARRIHDGLRGTR